MLETRTRLTVCSASKTDMLRSGAWLLASAVTAMATYAVAGPGMAYGAMWIVIGYEAWRFTTATARYSRVMDLDR